jgi:hypothetical protein
MRHELNFYILCTHNFGLQSVHSLYYPGNRDISRIKESAERYPECESAPFFLSVLFRTMDSAETKWFALMLGNVGEWSHDVEKLLRP